MEDIQFEELWEKEERRGVEQHLQRDYPAWLRRRQRTLWVAAAVVVMAVAAVPLLKPASPADYDNVYCNRSGIADAHWATMAGEILTRSLL